MKSLPIFLSLLVCLFLMSCQSSALLQKGETSYYSISELDSIHTYQLKPDDKISVSIWDHEDLSIGSIYGIYNSNEVYGKWEILSGNGEVTLPKIGAISLLGLTARQAKEKLTIEYSKFINNPIISIKILNREISILGEVKTPGVYLLEKEKNTLLEYLSKAGGANFYANTKEIILIRDQKQYLINLHKRDNLTSKNIVLQNRDIIHVPVLRGKTLDKKAPTLIPFTSVLTTLAIVFSIFNNQ